MLNYPRNLDQNYINYLIIGNKHMSLANKVKEMISNPISVSYKEKKEFPKQLKIKSKKNLQNNQKRTQKRVSKTVKK